MKERVTFGSIITDILIVLGTLIVIGNVYLIVVGMKDDKLHGIFGYKFLVELSDSMKDTIQTGDLVIIHDVDVNDIQNNDILSYRDNNDAIITHRVISIQENDGNRLFETKGDNNHSADVELVSKDLIEGTYVMRISHLGFVLVFLGSTTGKIVAVLVFAIIILISLFIYELKKGNKKKEEELEII